MVYVKCLEKIRNKNGVITDYKLIDRLNNIKLIDSDTLKQNIINKQIFVINLKLTADGRLIDRSETELKDKSKENSKQHTTRIKLINLLNKTLESTLLTVLKDYNIKYNAKYSNINNIGNKVFADITVAIGEDTLNGIAITIELEQKTEFEYEFKAYSSSSKTDFNQKAVPELHHSFLVNTKSKCIKAEYKQKKIIYADNDYDDDKVIYNIYKHEYKSTKEMLADITDYLALYIKRNVSSDNIIDKYLIDMQKVNNDIDILNKAVANNGFKNTSEPIIRHYSDFRKVYAVQYMKNEKLSNSKITFSLELYLNKYRETKVDITVDIYNYLYITFKQSLFEEEMNREITIKQFAELILSSILDFFKYNSYLEKNIISCVNTQLKKFDNNIKVKSFGSLDSLNEKNYLNTCKAVIDTSKNSNRKVKLGFLNNYLYNKSMRFYIKFEIEASRLTRYDIDIEDAYIVGVTFSKDKIEIGNIKYTREKELVDSFYEKYKYIENVIKTESLENIERYSIDYNMDYSENKQLTECFKLDKLLNRLNLEEINIKADILTKIVESKELEEFKCYPYSSWLNKNIEELTKTIYNSIRNEDCMRNTYIKNRVTDYTVDTNDKRIKVTLETLIKSYWLLYKTDKVDSGYLFIEKDIKNKEDNSLYSSIIVETNHIQQRKELAERFNILVEKIEKEIEFIKYIKSEGKQKIQNVFQELNKYANSLGLSTYIDEDSISIYPGMTLGIKVEILNNCISINDNAVMLKLLRGGNNSEYSADICNEVKNEVLELIKNYTEQNILTIDKWEEPVRNIIQYIMDKTDEEQLKLGLQEFNNEETSEETDNSEFDWFLTH